MLSEKNKAVLKQYFLNNYKNMLDYAFACLQNKSLAEIAVRDTFETAAKLSSFDRCSDLVGWLYGVLKYKIRKIRRERQLLLARLAALDLVTTASTETAADDPSFDSGEDLRLLYCFYVEGQSLEELTAEWESSADAMKSRLIQARKDFWHNAKSTALEDTGK